MKNFTTFILAMFIGVLLQAQGTLSADQRKKANDYLNQTSADFLKSLEGLTDAQLTFKADTSRWSILQCAEHIALAETGLWMQMQGLLQQPADAAKAAEIKFNEEQIISMLTNRTMKFKAPEPVRPTGQFPSVQAARDAFLAQRGKLIEYVNNTNDELLTHIWAAPFGAINLYQYVYFVSAHTKRHTLQIEEVKTATGYPK